MASKKDVAISLGVDLTLLAGKVNDKELFSSVESKLSKLEKKFKEKGVEIPLKQKLDTKQIESDANNAVGKLKRSLAAASKRLETSRDLSTAVHEKFKQAKDTIVKDGKVLESEWTKVLRQLAQEVGAKGSFGPKGTNPLKAFLGIDGKTLDAASKELLNKTKQLNAALDDIDRIRNKRLEDRAKQLQNRIAKINQAFEAGQARTQARIERSEASIQSLAPRQGQKYTEYTQAKDPSFKASQDVQKAAMSSYLTELRRKAGVAERLLKSEDFLAGAGPGAKQALTDQLASLRKEIPLVSKEINDLTGSIKAAPAATSTATKSFNEAAASIDKLKVALKSASNIARSRETEETLKKQAQAVNKLADAYRSLGDPKSLKKAQGLDVFSASIQKRIDKFGIGKAEQAAYKEEARRSAEAFRVANEGRILSRVKAEQAAYKEEAARNAEAFRLANEGRILSRTKAEQAAYKEEARRSAETFKVANEGRITNRIKAEQEAYKEEARRSAEAFRLANEGRILSRTKAEQAAYKEEAARNAEAFRIANEGRITNRIRAEQEAYKEEAKRSAEAFRLANEGRILSRVKAEQAAYKEEARRSAEAFRADPYVAAKKKMESAYSKLQQAEAVVQTFAKDSKPSHRMEMYNAERRALEAYIVALRQLITVEKDATARGAFEADLKNRIKALHELEQRVGGVDSALIQLGRAFQAFVRYAVVYQVLYQIRNAFTQVTSAVLDLQDALTSIKAVTLATTNDMQSVESAVKSVAETTAFTTDEIAKGGQTLVQAGIGIQEFPKALRATANLASATGATFQQGAEVMTTFMNVFNELDPDTISDKLANAVNISKLNIQDLSTIANYLLSTAEGFNVSFENTLALATTLRNAGFKASTIATGSRQAMLELLSPDEKTLKALERRYAEIGMAMSKESIAAMFAGFKGSKNPVLAAVNEMEKLGFGTLAADQLNRVFDVRAESVIKSWIQNKQELIANEQALERTGTAARGAQTQLESLQKSTQNLGEAIVGLVYDQSKGLVGWFRDIVQGATSAVESIKEMVTTLKAATGESGVGSAVITGGATFAAGLASRMSVAKSGVLGALALAAESLIRVFGQGSLAAEGFAKAVEAASIAILASTGLSVLTGGKIGTMSKAGAVPTTGIEKFKAGMWDAKAAPAGGKAKMITDAVVISSSLANIGGFFAGAADKLKNLGSIVLTFFRANPVILWTTGILTLLGAAKKYFTTDAEALKAKADALATETQKIKDEQVKIAERESAVKAAREQTASLRERLTTTEARITDLIGKSPEARALAEKAAKGFLAVGSQSLEAFIEQLAKITGKSAESFDRSDVAGRLQELNTINEQLEARRATYINELKTALSAEAEGKDTAADKEFLASFRALPQAQQALLSTTQTTTSNALALMDALNDAMSKAADGMDMSDKLIEAQVNQLEPFREMAKGSKLEDAFYRGILKSKDFAGTFFEDSAKEYFAGKTKGKSTAELAIREAVERGETRLVERLIENWKDVFSPEFIESMRTAAAANLQQKLRDPFDKILKDLEASLPAVQKEKPSLYKLGAPGAQAARESELAAQKTALEAQLAVQQAKLKEAAIAGQQVKTVEEQEKYLKQSKEIQAEIATTNEQLSKYKKEELDGEAKLKAVKQSFYGGQVEIQALEKRLKMLQGAKLKDYEAETAVTEQIFKLKQQQLAVEKETLAENLRKLLLTEGYSAEGMSPEDLVKNLSGEAARDLLKNSSEVAEGFKALANVTNEEAQLREKLATDLDNIARTELEAKKKVSEKTLKQADTKVTTLQGQLQDAGERLRNAQESLAEAYEKRAELEAFFSSALQEVSGKKLTASDVRAKIQAAAASGSVELAKEAAGEAKGLNKSEATKLISEARDVALNIQDQEIAQRDVTVLQLTEQYNYLATELQTATQAQYALKESLDTLTGRIDGLAAGIGGKVEALSSKQGFASGGFISGKGSSTSDSIPILASNGEFMQPANAVALYGREFMESLRNLQLDPSIARAISAKPLGGTTAQKQKQMQPVMFNVGDAIISAQAQPNAVKEFQAALRLQAVKNGRRI